MWNYPVVSIVGDIVLENLNFTQKLLIFREEMKIFHLTKFKLKLMKVYVMWKADCLVGEGGLGVKFENDMIEDDTCAILRGPNRRESTKLRKAILTLNKLDQHSRIKI